jgi:DNA-binding YbaB/EbfC family protein
VTDVPPDFQELLKHTQDLQEQIALARSDLAETELTRTVGEGLVAVTMTGDGRVTRVAFDEAVFDQQDVASLGTLTLAAVTQAADAVNALSTERMTAIRGNFEAAVGRPLPY